MLCPVNIGKMGFTAEEICSYRQKFGIVSLPKDHKSKM